MHLDRANWASLLAAPSLRVFLMLVAALGSAACSDAQSPQGAGNLVRYEIELQFRSLWGLTHCDGGEEGADTFAGVVSGDETSDPEEIVYTGVLTRTTRIGACEAWRPNGSEDVWCLPVVTGAQSTVDAVVTVWPGSGQAVSVELEARSSPGDVATVSGACTPEIESDLLATYFETDAVGIEPPQDSALEQRLAPGVWEDMLERPASQPDGWTLTVREIP